MFGQGKKAKREPFEVDRSHHFCCDLLPIERMRLLELLEHDKMPTIKERQMLAQKIRDAARKPGAPLPRAYLGWAEIEATARNQKCSVAEVIWDRAKAKDPELPPRRHRKDP